MENFSYYNPAKIIFGVDAIQNLEDQLKKYHVTSLLMIYSGDYVEKLGIRKYVTDLSQKLNITFYENGNVTPNPKIELVRELITLSKSKQINFILAVGGGSVIDTAKAVAIGQPYENDVWDFFTNVIEPSSALPVGVISTIPASGSESSNASIISNGLLKRGIEFDCLIPQFAILDPSYTITLPKYQTSCGCADILSHLLERYLSNTQFTDTTDYLIEGAIQALMINACRLVDNPSNLNARSEIQCLGFIAHNNLLDIGRISDWGAHRIEHELSAQYGITHGEGMSVTMLGILKYYHKHNSHKLIQLYNRLFADQNDITDDEKCIHVISQFEHFFQNLGLRTNLTQFNITNEAFDIMAQRATDNDTHTVGHYIPLNAAKIVDVLNLCL